MPQDIRLEIRARLEELIKVYNICEDDLHPQYMIDLNDQLKWVVYEMQRAKKNFNMDNFFDYTNNRL